MRMIVVFPQPPEFQLEIHQLDAGAQKQAGKEIIDADGEIDDVVQILRAGPAERGDVLFAHPGIMQPVILVVIFDDGAGQGGAFLDPQPLGHGAGGDIAHHHFQRNDLDFLDQLLAHVEAAHEMGGHADPGQLGHQIFADAVVEDALAFDRRLLGGVERRWCRP